MTHYSTTVKYRKAQVEKRLKKAKKTLGITGAGLSYEDDICKSSYIMDKWHEI